MRVSAGLESTNNTSKSWKRFVLPIVAGVGLVVVAGSVWFLSVVSEIGLEAFIPGRPRPSSLQSRVHLKNQSIYEIKKKQEIVGVQVTRIVSKQQPEEFLVLDGVSSQLVDNAYGKKPNLVWVNLIARQLLKMRESGEGEALPLSVEVQNIKTLGSGMIQQDHQRLPYWQLEVQFKLSNESQPRYYQVGVVRKKDAISAEPSKDRKVGFSSVFEPPLPKPQDTLVVGYAQKEVFQKELVADLIRYLSFE